MTLCAECGFDWEGDADAVVDEVAALAPRFISAIVELDEEELRARPAPGVWSALEYLVHMRDVVLFYGNRIARVLNEDRPQFESRNFGALAEIERYNDQDPASVASELRAAGAEVAATLVRLAPEQWSRCGIRTMGGDVSLLMLGRRLAHESVHHALDIERGRTALGSERQ